MKKILILLLLFLLPVGGQAFSREEAIQETKKYTLLSTQDIEYKKIINAIKFSCKNGKRYVEIERISIIHLNALRAVGFGVFKEYRGMEEFYLIMW